MAYPIFSSRAEAIPQRPPRWTSSSDNLRRLYRRTRAHAAKRSGRLRPLDANRDGKLDRRLPPSDRRIQYRAATFPEWRRNLPGASSIAPPCSRRSVTTTLSLGCSPRPMSMGTEFQITYRRRMDQWIFVLIGDRTGRFTVKSIIGGYPSSESQGFFPTRA